MLNIPVIEERVFDRLHTANWDWETQNASKYNNI